MFRCTRMPLIALLIAFGIHLPLRAEPADMNSTASRPVVSKTQVSNAERIVRLEETIADNERELAELKARLDTPDSEYTQAKAEFTDLDRKLKELDKTLQRAAASQPAASEPAELLSSNPTEELRGQLESVRKQWSLTKERFDLAIREDAAGKAKAASLSQKLKQDREALTKLQNPEPAASQPAGAVPAEDASSDPAGKVARAGVVVLPAGGAPATAISTPSAASPPATLGPAGGSPATPAPTSPGGTAASAKPSAPAAPPSQAISVAPGVTVSAAPSLPEPPKKAPPSRELIAAQQKAQDKHAQAAKAEQEVQSISQRITTLRGNIKTEDELLQTARRKAENAKQTRDLLRSEIQAKTREGAPVDEVTQLWNKADEAKARATQAENDVNSHISRLEELRVELDALQAENIAALKEAERKREELVAAEKTVRQLENPFAPLNLLQWLLDHGPRIVAVLLSMIVLWWLTRLAEGRIAGFIARGHDPEHSPREREARARTLASVFRNTASTVIVVGSSLMILTEIGINVLPLLGGAAVVGLAVAFGAQALIKDYFSGFIILLENQYAINDVVRIGDTAGLVERISLRMTVLRDLEGNAHFVPHGEIKQVTNMTHGWSRALFAVGVAYKEQVDRVMQVLLTLGEELCDDPKFRPLVLGKPEMLGVDAFGNSEVVIKFMIKTRPLQQWAVKREMLRRIKNRFDELGIEIPFPHRTIYHRYEADGASEPLASASRLQAMESRG